MKRGIPAESVSHYQPLMRRIYNIDPYDYDAELGISNYNESKSRGIKKSVIDRIRGRE